MKKVKCMASLVAGAAFCVLVAGCASAERSKAARQRNPAPCPNIITLTEAARLIDFDGDQSIENVAWSAEIEDVSLACRYFADEPIEASVDLDFAFGRGPKSDSANRTYSYFVAVTRANREVIAKETFTIDVNFKGDAVKRVSESVDKIVIPRATESIAGGNFEVIVGLVVTPEQAVFNRSGKSLKFPEL